MAPLTETAIARHSENQHARIYAPADTHRSFDEAPHNGIVEGSYRSGNTTKADPWTYLLCPEEPLIAHKDGIIVAVKGACRGNGQDNARGSIGVFFHKDSRLNRSLELDDASTSQRADFLAAIRALKISLRIRTRYVGRPSPPGPYRKLRRVIVKTNSKYVVDAMTTWMEKWEANGFRNAKGKAVVNEDLFRRLERLVAKLEKLKVLVQFWFVEKERNGEAFLLAKAALDGVGKLDALREREEAVAVELEEESGFTGAEKGELAAKDVMQLLRGLDVLTVDDKVADSVMQMLQRMELLTVDDNAADMGGPDIEGVRIRSKRSSQPNERFPDCGCYV